MVNVGGGFVATTLKATDSAFMAGGSLTFSGPSSASVINLGQIGASAGDVVLTARTVENDGTVSAPNGDVGRLAGSEVTLSDALGEDGKFSVLLGSGSSATNIGSISGALAELRAYGGNVYALAGDTGGAIVATGTQTGQGKVFLVAEGGDPSVAGTIKARGPGGSGGASRPPATRVIVDADSTLNNTNGAAGATRPMLTSKYSTTITNVHQLQLMAMDLGASYVLGSDVYDFGDEALEARSIYGRGAGPAQIVVNDADLFAAPAKSEGPVDEAILEKS